MVEDATGGDRVNSVSVNGRASGCLGASLPARDVIDRVQGRPLYVADWPSDDAALCRVVWPQVDHAELQHVDVSKAERLPGVIAVLTAKDIPGVNAYGPVVADQPVLAEDRIRYRGDPVALVVAESGAAAAAAADLVEIALRPLSPVYRAEDALSDSAPRLFKGGNEAIEYTLTAGDIEAGRREADHVVEGRFRVPAIEHAYLEPESGIAEWQGEDLVIFSGCQNLERVHPQLAAVLDIPGERIRLVAPPVGGGFGGKLGNSIQALLALAAYVTKRRVRLTLTREESVLFTSKRHPMSLAYRMGFDDAGRFVFLEGDILANCGAYQTLSSILVTHSVNFSTGPYRIPHVRVTGRGVFTNTPPSGAMRGFGVVQPTFAVECLLDEAAERLGLSPIEIRRINGLRPGDCAPIGEKVGEECHFLATLDALEDGYNRAAEAVRDRPGWGVGFASAWKNYGEGLGHDDYAEAEVEILPEGKVLVRVGSIDIGQGAPTVLAQVAAERLGVSYNDVDVQLGDTRLGLRAGSTAGSRQTTFSGNAALKAIDALVQAAIQASDLDTIADGASITEGRVTTSTRAVLDLFELARTLAARGERLVGRGTYRSPQTFPAGCDEGGRIYFGYAYFSNYAVVAVDAVTGETRVEELHSSYDVGRAINRCKLEGQLEGGAMMGLGYALTEEFHADACDRSIGLHDCGVPHIASLPTAVTWDLIETGDAHGPFGSKGLGEAPAIPVAPAISNAIHDAMGIRMWDLPASPAKIKEALQSACKCG